MAVRGAWGALTRRTGVLRSLSLLALLSSGDLGSFGSQPLARLASLPLCTSSHDHLWPSTLEVLRLRGGALRPRGKGTTGGKTRTSFYTGAGELVKVNDEGDVVKTSSDTVKEALRKRDYHQQGLKERAEILKVVKPPSEKRIQGIMRRQAKRESAQAALDQSITEISGKGLITHQDPNWRKYLDPSMPYTARESLESKYMRQVRFMKTSEERTAKVAKKMVKVSRRKGRKSEKLIGAKQMRHIQAIEEYKLSGEKEQRAEEKEKMKQRELAALVLHKQMGIVLTKKQEKRLTDGKVSAQDLEGQILLDDGTNQTKEWDLIEEFAKDIEAEWLANRVRAQQNADEHKAYLSSKEYIKKQKRDQVKKKKLAIIRRKVRERQMTNRRKKQLKVQGVDKFTVNPEKVTGPDGKLRLNKNAGFRKPKPDREHRRKNRDYKPQDPKKKARK